MKKGSKYLKENIFLSLSAKVKNKKNETSVDTEHVYKLKQGLHYQQIQKNFFKPKLINKTGRFLFLFLFFLFPRKSFLDSQCYIELKVNKNGENQILSNEYNVNFPINYKYDNEGVNSLYTKYFNFPSKEKTIKLFYSSCYILILKNLILT